MHTWLYKIVLNQILLQLEPAKQSMLVQQKCEYKKTTTDNYTYYIIY